MTARLYRTLCTFLLPALLGCFAGPAVHAEIVSDLYTATVPVAQRSDAALAEAHDLMTRLLVGTRLLAPDLDRPNPAAAALLARQSGCEDYACLIERLGAARADVAAAWQDIYGETLELDE